MSLPRVNMSFLEVYELLLASELWLRQSAFCQANLSDFAAGFARTCLKTRRRLEPKINPLSEMDFEDTYGVLADE